MNSFWHLGTTNDTRRTRSAHEPPITQQVYTLAVIMLVSLIARLPGLATESLWYDETASWWFSRLPLRQLWIDVPFVEPHPPLYYTLLKWWTSIWGSSELGLRSLSAIASVLTIPIVYLAGKSLFPGRDGWWVGTLAAFLVALHPMQLRYAQEARPYALLILAVAIIVLGFSLGLSRRDASPRQQLLYAGYVSAGSILAYWMHNTAILLVGVVVFVGTAITWLFSSSQKYFLAFNAVLGLVALLAWTPNIPWIVSQTASLREGFWIPVPTLGGSLYTLDMLIGSAENAESDTGRLFATGIASCVAALGILRLVLSEGGKSSAIFLSAATALPFVVCIVASLIVTPIFLPRTIVWIQIPFALLFACGLLWLRPRGAAIVASIAVVGILVGVDTLGWSRPVKEPWRDVAGVLKREARRADLIIAYPAGGAVPLEYYGVAGSVPVPVVAFPEPWLSYDRQTGSIVVSHRSVDGVNVDSALNSLTRGHETIWVVNRKYNKSNPVAKALKQLRGEPIVRFNFRDSILVVEYPPSLTADGQALHR